MANDENFETILLNDGEVKEKDRKQKVKARVRLIFMLVLFVLYIMGAVIELLYPYITQVKEQGVTYRKMGLFNQNYYVKSCDESFKEVTILPEINGKSVVKIGDNAFADCTELKSIEMFDGIEEIGNSAFENCVSLEQLTLPGTVNKLGRNPFKGCKSLHCCDVTNGFKVLAVGYSGTIEDLQSLMQNYSSLLSYYSYWDEVGNYEEDGKIVKIRWIIRIGYYKYVG